MISDPQLLAKVTERHIVKLASIIQNKNPRNSKAAYYVLPDKVSDILLSDSCHGLYFHPFSKIINPYY